MTRIKTVSRHVLKPFVISLAMIGIVACSSSPPDEGRSGAIPLDRMETSGLERIATRFKEAGEPLTALKFYMEALQREPDNARLHVEAGELNLALGERAKAQTHFERALAIEPLEARAVTRLAGLYISDGNAQKANSLLADLHDHDEGTTYSLNLQAVALDLLGRSFDARRVYAKALQMAPDDAYIMSNMALSMAIAGEFSAARDMLEELAGKESDSSFAYENLALITAMAGQPEDAMMIAVKHMDPELARANREFYERLATITPTDRAQAIFLGHLPPIIADAPSGGGTEEAAFNSADNLNPADDALGIQDIDGEIPGEEVVPDAEAENAPVSNVAEVVADAIPSYHLQLGSFDSPQRLIRGWNELKDMSALEGFSPYYEKARSAENDPTLRLLVGPFQGYSAAKAICESLIAERKTAGCVILPQRTDVILLEPKDF